MSRPGWAWIAVAAAVCLAAVPGPSAYAGALQLVFVAPAGLFVVAGWVCAGRPADRRNGALLFLIGLGLLLSGLDRIPGGPWAFVTAVSDPSSFVLMGLLLLRWPGDRLGRLERWWVRLAVVVPLLGLADALTWHPPPATRQLSWWPEWGFPALNDAVYGASKVVAGAAMASLAVLVCRRVVTATPLQRRELLPVLLSLAAWALGGATAVTLELLGGPSTETLALPFGVALLTFPLSLLASMAVRRLQRALAVERLLQPARMTDTEAVRTALARVLGDPALTLTLWSSADGTYVSPDGGAPADGHPGRWGVDIFGADGEPLARVGLDARLAERADFVEVVARAASVSLDMARLQVRLRGERAMADESRSRLAAVEIERQRLSRLVPTGLAERLRADPSAMSRTERLTVTVLMSDVRGYSAIAETADPASLAGQLNEHRRAMNGAVLDAGGTVMQYVGDAVLAVFGAPHPCPDHARRALVAAEAMHVAQERLNASWASAGRPPFGLGIGVSTGEVATAFLGSEERVEYTVVGDTVNLAARLCDAARPAGSTVAGAATVAAAGAGLPWETQLLPPLQVKGRAASVAAFEIRRTQAPTLDPQAALFSVD